MRDEREDLDARAAREWRAEQDRLNPLSKRGIADALNINRHAEILRLCELAISYWNSLAFAAERGEAHLKVLHSQQIVRVTRETIALVRALGGSEAET